MRFGASVVAVETPRHVRDLDAEDECEARGIARVGRKLRRRDAMAGAIGEEQQRALECREAAGTFAQRVGELAVGVGLRDAGGRDGCDVAFDHADFERAADDLLRRDDGARQEEAAFAIEAREALREFDDFDRADGFAGEALRASGVSDDGEGRYAFDVDGMQREFGERGEVGLGRGHQNGRWRRLVAGFGDRGQAFFETLRLVGGAAPPATPTRVAATANKHSFDPEHAHDQPNSSRSRDAVIRLTFC